MAYKRNQTVNEWSDMLVRIYDKTQNYSKTPFEIHSHLTEVTGAFGKFLFKKSDYVSARAFLPKMFVWAVAMSNAMKVSAVDLQAALLTKYPRVCPYCRNNPCDCWNSEKKEINYEAIRKLYFQNADKQDKSVNGFQMMFREIYGDSWKNLGPNETPAVGVMKSIFTRLVEELAEVSEAIRFHHLYPSNFSNEIADYFAWWFAAVSNFHLLERSAEVTLAEDLLWGAYPGRCLECGLIPCDCRSGPVRELLSKPSLDKLDTIDALTQAENFKALEAELTDISNGIFPVPVPLTLVAVDLDDLKSLNEQSYIAANMALKTVVNVMRQKGRARDRIFRYGGDEFIMLCPDRMSLESVGMSLRILASLKDKPIRSKADDGSEIERTVSISVGIGECIDLESIQQSLELALARTKISKAEGKGCITFLDSNGSENTIRL